MAELLWDNIEAERHMESQGESSSGSKHATGDPGHFELAAMFWDLYRCHGFQVPGAGPKHALLSDDVSAGGSAVRGQWVDGLRYGLLAAGSDRPPL